MHFRDKASSRFWSFTAKKLKKIRVTFCKSRCSENWPHSSDLEFFQVMYTDYLSIRTFLSRKKIVFKSIQNRLARSSDDLETYHRSDFWEIIRNFFSGTLKIRAAQKSAYFGENPKFYIMTHWRSFIPFYGCVTLVCVK